MAAEVAWSIWAGCSGWMRIRGRWPSRTPRVGSRKMVPVLLAWPNSDRRAVRVCRRSACGQQPGGGGDVGGGDLAQVGVVPGPFQQQRVDPVEVHPDGVLVAGAAAGPALAAGAQPVPDVGGHRRRQQREPGPHQGGEGGDPVIVQEPGQFQDLGGAGDAQVPAVQGRRQLGPGDHVSGCVIGQDDSQRPAGLEDDPGVPAAGPGEFGSDPPGQGQGLAVDSGGGPVAGVEVPRVARGAQLQLRPGGRAGWRNRPGGSGARGRPGAAEAAHARQR